jgi:hypothetical protein
MTSGQPINRTLASIILISYVLVLAVISGRAIREQRVVLSRRRKSGGLLTRLRQR